jgi:hypothetical protein
VKSASTTLATQAAETFVRLLDARNAVAASELQVVAASTSVDL